MTITALPAAPSTADPANFNTKADTFIAALGTFVTETNAVAAAMNINSTTDTSATSVLIGTGAKTFTVTAGKSFQPGMYLVIADTAAPSTNSMYGQVTSYSGTSLVMNITGIVGSGTKTAWTISQSASNAYATAAGTATTATTVTGSAVVTGAISSSSPTAGIGYANGAGGSVGQITSFTTAVTLNTICGRVTTVYAAMTAGTAYSFIVNNSSCTTLDTVFVSEAINHYAHPVSVGKTNNGSFEITWTANTTQSNNLTFNFTIMKNVTA